MQTIFHRFPRPSPTRLTFRLNLPREYHGQEQQEQTGTLARPSDGIPLIPPLARQFHTIMRRFGSSRALFLYKGADRICPGRVKFYDPADRAGIT